MPEFRKMWGQDSYSFDGRFFSMPERNVLPKPYVKPHPPMWVAAGNPETFEKAGELGLGVICFTGGSPEKMKPLVDIYKEAVADAEPVGDYVNDNVAITTSFMCLEDGDAARDWMTRSPATAASRAWCSSTSTRSRSRRASPSGPTRSPTPPSSSSRSAPRRAPRSSARPTSAPRSLQKWDAIGVDQLIMGPTGSTYPYELVEESVELFGNKVIPQFDDSPDEARAARFRREAAERLGLA